MTLSALTPVAPATLPVVAGGVLRAQTDREAVGAWLAMYRGRGNTFPTYAREATRFCLWLESNGLTLARLTHEDMLAFAAFLANPPSEWIESRAYRATDARWRPFRRALAQKSVRQAQTIINGLLAWLVSARYIEANPLALLRRPRSGKRNTIARFLTRDQWTALLDAVEALPRQTQSDQRRYARDRWMTRLLYITALRASEAVEHTMGAFGMRDTPAGPRWNLTIVGKGNKERLIPAPAELLDELRLYRKTMGLPPDPAPDDPLPLIGAIDAPQRPITRSGLFRALKALFGLAAARCENPADAAKLKRASTHWLRHTRATNLVSAHVSLNSVRDLLGHASIATTSLYAHEELDRMQDEIERADQAAATGSGAAN